MLLRLWQFSAGFMALFWNKIEVQNLPKDKDEYKNVEYPVSKSDVFTVALSILGFCIFPNNIDVLWLRPAVTMATAFIIAAESSDSQILSSKLLAYIGGISYVLYLVHWPIIAIFQPYTVQNYVFVIVTTFLSSILLHQIFEEKYLKLDRKMLISFVIALFLGNCILQYSVRNQSFWDQVYPADIQATIEANKAQMPNSWSKEKNRFECSEERVDDPKVQELNFGYGTCEKGTGNFSIMMIGNSFVLSLYHPLRYHFHHNYSDFRFISLGGRYPETLKGPVQENDGYVQQMNENLKFYEKFVKRIYILGAHPLYQVGLFDSLVQKVMSRPEALEGLHLNRKKADKEMKFVRKRLSMIECQKCKIFELGEVFIDGDKYLTHDPEGLVSYADNMCHISAAGLKLCDLVLKTIAQDVMNTV
ncbi:unnamed protein product [Caenorhabditis nigoni]